MDKKEMAELAYQRVQLRLKMMSNKEIFALLPEAKKAMSEVEVKFLKRNLAKGADEKREALRVISSYLMKQEMAKLKAKQEV